MRRMSVTLDGKKISLLDQRRPTSVSGFRNGVQIADEIVLISTKLTIHMLVAGTHINANPVDIFTMKKQPSIANVFDRFAPVCMPGVNWKILSTMKRETWDTYHFDDAKFGVKGIKTYVGEMIFANNEKHDVFFAVRPTSKQDLAESLRWKTSRKSSPGRKRYYSNSEMERVENAIKGHDSSIRAAAEHLKMPYNKAQAIHEAARKRNSRKPCQ
jgi:hypothetical protein